MQSVYCHVEDLSLVPRAQVVLLTTTYNSSFQGFWPPQASALRVLPTSPHTHMMNSGTKLDLMAQSSATAALEAEADLLSSKPTRQYHLV